MFFCSQMILPPLIKIFWSRFLIFFCVDKSCKFFFVDNSIQIGEVVR